MSSRRRINKWLVGGVLILIATIVAVVAILMNQPKEPVEESTNGSSQVENTAEKTTTKEDEEAEKQPENIKEPVPQYSGDNPNESEVLTGVISYAGVSGDNLIIRVNIDQYLNSGVCKVRISQNENVFYEQEVAIEGSVSTSTCDGFSIPVAGLLRGNSSVEIMLQSGEKYGKIVREVNI